MGQVESLSTYGLPLPGFFIEGSLASDSAPEPIRSCTREVPKIIHFIWVMSPLREPYAHNILGFANKNPAWQVWLWVDQPIKNSSRHILRNSARRPAGAVAVRSL